MIGNLPGGGIRLMTALPAVVFVGSIIFNRVEQTFMDMV